MKVMICDDFMDDNWFLKTENIQLPLISEPKILEKDRPLINHSDAYSCDICNCRFRNRSTTSYHRKMHDGPFFCTTCDKSYVYPTGLKKPVKNGCPEKQRKIEKLKRRNYTNQKLQNKQFKL